MLTTWHSFLEPHTHCGALAQVGRPLELSFACVNRRDHSAAAGSLPLNPLPTAGSSSHAYSRACTRPSLPSSRLLVVTAGELAECIAPGE